MKPVTQYLTAVFELRPSRRKAAALERVRSAAEAVQRGLVCDVAMVDCTYAEMAGGGCRMWPRVATMASLALCKVENAIAA